MSIFLYLRQKGFKHALLTIWKYKIDDLIRRILLIFVHNKPLKNVIIIESHNDFDCNGGAFYEYLVKNGYNKKYKIVWTIKNPMRKDAQLPNNVVCVPLFTPSIKKDYYYCVAKFLFCDCEIVKKVRTNQISVYCTHGGCTFKNVKGLLEIPPDVDYILCSSENYAPLMCSNYSIQNPNDKILCIGFPSNDQLFDVQRNDLHKLTGKEYKKTILWMPTFRKMIGGRKDGVQDSAFGLPIINNYDELDRINRLFAENDSVLLIKYHPMQDLEGVEIPKDYSNIVFITGKTMKDEDLDIYVMMKDVDALISDYSSSAYTYLLLNRPIGFVLSDLEDYKLGFSIDNYDDILVGMKIKDLNDLITFFSDVFCGNDNYAEKRNNLSNWLYKYHDGKTCDRLVEFLGL